LRPCTGSASAAGRRRPSVASGYLAYLVTPEEYERQHYDGGDTVCGV